MTYFIIGHKTIYHWTNWNQIISSLDNNDLYKYLMLSF